MSDRIEVPCPNCGTGKVRCTLTDIANQRTVSCTRGCRVKLEDQGGGARKMDRELKKLDREIQKLNRTIRIKF